MFNIKKLLLASLAVTTVFSASICAGAAQIDSLSIVDKTLYATTDAENARLYVAEYSEGLLSDVFFKDVENGNIELFVSDASEYDIFLWDKDSLAPVSSVYHFSEGRAFEKGSETPIPEYEFNDYFFNQDDDVMVVSSISETSIAGFKAGVETTYALTDEVAIWGLSDNIADVVPGSVVLIGTNKLGECAAVELLASMGLPIDEDGFKADYGVYTPSDGSTKYENVVDIMFSKSGTKLTLREKGGIVYNFASFSLPCYRVGLAMQGDTPIVTVTEKLLSATKEEEKPFKNTSEFSNYVYLRINKETSKITQCVIYSVPKELNFNPDPDDPYSPIFGLTPIVIID